ncbi:MAG: protoheme IX farnesyltransferase [Alphaproteobacteria bacterium]|nr:protoheme IX farnesyltransferase [Alphaproteobacteria bacterium]
MARVLHPQTGARVGPATATSPGPVAARDVLGIFKPRIAVSIMLSAIGGLAITPGALPDAWRTAVMAFAVFLAAGAAGAFNQWAESDLDANMARTAGRPFASGRLHAGWAWLATIVGLLAFAVGVAAAALNPWTAFYTFMGAFTYAVIYTVWLKRRTWLNIVVGGAAGSFAVLAGSAAVDPGLSPEAILLAIVLFLWTPPHFWSLAIAAHQDYEANLVPMLPVVVGDVVCAKVILAHTVALCLIALLPAVYGMGWIYLAFAAVGGTLFTAASIRLVMWPTKRRAIHNFLASLAQLVLLLSGIVVDRWLLGSPV